MNYRLLLPVILLCAACMSGCGKKAMEPPVMLYQSSSIIPDKAERISFIMPMLEKTAGIQPTEAHFILMEHRDKKGRGSIISSAMFAAVQVDKATLASAQTRWTKIPTPSYQPAFEPVTWLPEPEQFGSLQFFSVKDIMLAPEGFVALYPNGDTFFVFAAKPGN